MSNLLANLILTEDLDTATHVLIKSKMHQGLKVTEGKIYELGRWEANASSLGEAELFIINDDGRESTTFMLCCKKEFYKQK
ncbi:hypothetical protein D1872_291530 [compost metagenome]